MDRAAGSLTSWNKWCSRPLLALAFAFVAAIRSFTNNELSVRFLTFGLVTLDYAEHMNYRDGIADFHRPKMQTALLATGWGGVLFVLTFIVLGAIAQNYDGLHEAISALEFTSVGFARRINFAFLV